MRNLLWLLPVAFFFLNPTLGCVSPDDPQFEYGAAEMRAAIAGSWTFVMTPDGADAATITLQLDEADSVPGATAHASAQSLVRAAHACGSRTLVKSAGACSDLTSMPLAVTFVSGDPSLMDAPLSGSFIVYGTRFQGGALEVTVGSYQVSASLLPDGTVVHAYLYVAGQGPSTAVTVTR